MTDRRNFVIGLVAGGLGLAVAAAPAFADTTVPMAEAQAAIDGFIDALFSGDPVRIDAVLAPEFQVLRADGKSYDKAAYLANLPQYKFRPRTRDLKVTSHEDLLVVNYLVETEQTVDGQSFAPLAPRLTVFHKEGAVWQVVSHANFAQLDK